MADLLRDLRFALRDLRRRPGYATAAILTLALGIGANALVFSLVDGILLRPLPYRDADRLVEVWNSWDDEPRARLAVPELRAYAESGALAVLAGFTQATFDLASGGDAERVTGAYATADVFAVLGVEPVLGRTFDAAEDRLGAQAVAVLGGELWTRRFAADPSIVGREIRVDGRPLTVVGVLPTGVRLPSDHRSGERTELWVPIHPYLTPELTEHWGMHFLQAAARLERGVALEQAQAELDVLVERLAEAAAATPGDAVSMESFRALLVPARDEVVGPVRRSLVVLLGAVGLVLLICCANVGHLALARARSRRREIVLRAALGASRGRVVRQLLAESATLALVGGAVGLGLAAGGLRLIVAAAPPGIPRLAEIALDHRVVVFTLLASAATALAFGLVPALRATRIDLAAGLRGAGGGQIGRGDARSGRPLIALEVALGVILVTGAGLLARTLWNLAQVDPGYRVDSLLTFEMAPPETSYADGASLDDVFRRLRDGIEALPGVERAGAVSHLPLSSERGDWNFYREDRPIAEDEPKPRGDWQLIEPGYLETMGIDVVEGRSVSDGDDGEAPLVLLVNESLARRYFAEGSPVGRRVRLGGDDANPYASIVGVVADARSESLGHEPVPELYLPYAQAARLMGSTRPRELTFAVRSGGSPALLIEAVRDVVERVDPELPLGNVRTMAQVRARSLASTRFATFALGGFAALAAVLGAVGIFGVVAHLAGERRREIGIRMALGAERSGVLALVLRQGMLPALAGIGAGVAGALALVRVLGGLLYEVQPADPLTLVAVVLGFAAVAAAASWAPALRASRLDPAVVLRDE